MTKKTNDAKARGKAAAKKTGKVAADKPAAETIELETVLGVELRGELEAVPLDAIDDPQLPEDRLPRPGDEESIREVAMSLREVGQLQPVMVERAAKGRFLRVFGRRRIAAAKLNKSKTILAIVVPPLPDAARRTIVAVENVQRRDLAPVEEHLAVAELLELQALHAAKQVGAAMTFLNGQKVTDELIAEAGKDHALLKAWSHDALLVPEVRARACEVVAAMLAKPASWVRDRMYVGRLGAKGRALVLAGRLPMLHAREICKVADPALREDLAVAYAAGGEESRSEHEAGDYNDLRREVGTRLFTLAQAPWRLDVPFDGLLACDHCPHNSRSQPGLFEHNGGVASKNMVGGVGRGGPPTSVPTTRSAPAPRASRGSSGWPSPPSPPPPQRSPRGRRTWR